METGEAHLLQRAPRISSNAGRLAPPTPLFAAAILPGAAAAVSIACPSPSSPGPGLSEGRRGPSVQVCLHAPTVPELLERTFIKIPKPGKITNRDLAPKKKKEKRKALHEGGWTGGVEVGGALRRRGLAPVRSPASAGWRAGGGPVRRRENFHCLGLCRQIL